MSEREPRPFQPEGPETAPLRSGEVRSYEVGNNARFQAGRDSEPLTESVGGNAVVALYSRKTKTGVLARIDPAEYYIDESYQELMSEVEKQIGRLEPAKTEAYVLEATETPETATLKKQYGRDWHERIAEHLQKRGYQLQRSVTGGRAIASQFPWKTRVFCSEEVVTAI